MKQSPDADPNMDSWHRKNDQGDSNALDKAEHIEGEVATLAEDALNGKKSLGDWEQELASNSLPNKSGFMN